jgi:hypothetical protein
MDGKIRIHARRASPLRAPEAPGRVGTRRRRASRSANSGAVLMFVTVTPLSDASFIVRFNDRFIDQSPIVGGANENVKKSS